MLISRSRSSTLRRPLASIVLSIAAALSYGAQPPDAGQTLRELQQPPTPRPSQKAPEVDTGPAPAQAEGADVRFAIKQVRIVGNHEIPTDELHALVARLEGREGSLKALNEAAAGITAYYRERGYTLARAYVPAQDIVDGVVTLAIVEGRIAQRRIENNSRLADDRVRDYLRGTSPGEVVKSADLDRSLLLLNDTPGVGGSRATLQPGASAGTTDLLVGLSPASPVSGTVGADNYGNRYTGESRLSATVNFNSPLRIGDQVTVSGLTSNQSLTYSRFAYQLPIGGEGLRFGVAYADTRYRLGKEFTSLAAHGAASSTSAFAVYPFVRTAQGNLYGIVSRERKSLSDSVDATATVTDKRVEVNTFGLTGSRQDLLGGGGLTSFELTAATGRLNINSPVARAIDDVSAQTRGNYARLSYAASRLQRIGEREFLSVALSGQQARKNLDSSEKFALGGAYGVRAFPQGEGIGDSGYLTNFEWRHAFAPNAQGIAFYDTGMVVTNRYPFSTSANTRYLSGAGLGLNASIGGLQLRSSLAWRTGGGRPLSVPPSASNLPLFWLQAGAAF